MAPDLAINESLIAGPLKYDARKDEAGKLRVLGTPSGVRSPAAGTPAAVVNKLNAEIARIMRRPDVKKQLSDLGAEAVTSTPQEFASFVSSEIDRGPRS